MRPIIKKKFIFLITLILIPAVFLLTEFVLYTQNSLYLNNEWIVQKRMRQMSLLGADEYLLSRYPLTQNELNLGTFFGFQEVIFKKSQKLKQIKFVFQLKNESYLDFTFARNIHSFTGIRLSTEKDSITGQFTSELNGKFINYKPFTLPPLDRNKHTANIIFSLDGAILKIDNYPEISLSAIQLMEGQWGFRAGLNGAKIFEVETITALGQPEKINFKNTKNYLNTFLINYILVFLIGIIFAKLQNNSVLNASRDALNHWIFISLLTIIIWGPWFLVDYFYYSKLIPIQSNVTRSIHGISSTNLDFIYYKFFQKWYQITGGEVHTISNLQKRGYPQDQIDEGPILCNNSASACRAMINNHFPSITEKTYRIVFIGTSETIGAGADHLSDTFFVKTHLLLKAKLASKLNLQSINISKSGENSTNLFSDYKNNFLKWHPHLVVINLSNNDSNSEVFKKNLTDLVMIHKRENIKTVFIKEPNILSNPTSEQLYVNHRVLEQIALKYEIPIWDLHAYLNSKEINQSGNIWWDFIHLTTYGQEIVANWLAPKLLEII